MRIGRSYTFSASRQIPKLGKCENLHGHDFKVDIELEGVTVDGVLIDFNELDKIVEDVISDLDHKHLNDVVIRGMSSLHYLVKEVRESPTVENLARLLYYVFKARFSNINRVIKVSRVRVYESERSWAEYGE